MRLGLPFLIGGLSVILGSNAYALPYNKNPQSFTHWFNAAYWSGGGRTVRLTYPHNCSFSTVSNEESSCKGFISVSDPTGSRVCEGTAYHMVGTDKRNYFCGTRRASSTYLLPQYRGTLYLGRRQNPQ